MTGSLSRSSGTEPAVREPTGQRRTFASLAVRNFRLYFIGQGISGAGTWMQNVTIGWFALQLSHSGAVLGLVTGARYVPPLLLGPWAGLVVDRVRSRALLVVTQSCAGVLSLTLAMLSATGRTTLPALAGLVVGIGLVDSVDVPGRQSMISKLVTREYVGNAVALSSVVANASRAVGPGLAGVVIASLGISACFFINTISFAAVIVALLLMRTDEFVTAPPAGEPVGHVGAALRYAWHTREIRIPLIMVAVTGTLTWEFPVSLPLLTSSTFHGTAGAYGLAMAALGIGAVVGGLVVARRRHVTIRSLSGSAIAWGAVILASALSPVLIAVYVLMLGVGACAITFNSAAKTLLQMTSKPHMRGRIMALWYMAWQGSTVVGAPLVGAIGNTAGARYALIVGAAAAALVGICFRRGSTGEEVVSRGVPDSIDE